jgi:N-acetylmuramoyl-L-alanine amidase
LKTLAGCFEEVDNMVYAVKDHHLYKDNQPVPFRRSPNCYGPGSLPVDMMLFLVEHFTAGEFQPSIDWMAKPGTNAGAHLVVSRAGDIVQMGEFDRAMYHAGRSAWAGYEMLNQYALGIEIANWGELIRVAGKTGWYAWNKITKIPDDQVRMVGKKAWHQYTDVQLNVVEDISVVLFNHYNLWEIVGHEQIAPGRKFDPGPLFPMAHIKAQVKEKSYEI